jgi:hypothetical protein
MCKSVISSQDLPLTCPPALSPLHRVVERPDEFWLRRHYEPFGFRPPRHGTTSKTFSLSVISFASDKSHLRQIRNHMDPPW